jgi:D-arabinitol 2-dehydrogenase
VTGAARSVALFPALLPHVHPHTPPVVVPLTRHAYCSGLGNLFARTFAESGSNSIVILDLQEELAQQAARDLVQQMVEHGEAKPDEVEALGIGVNVSDEAAVERAFKAIVDKFGRIDVLVTAAGIVHNYEATRYPTEKMRQLFGMFSWPPLCMALFLTRGSAVIDINVHGSFFCAREAAKHMTEKGNHGSIILIGSMSGQVVNVPQPQTPYNSSKAAVRQMAASLAVEWAKHNIRVNCLRCFLTLDPALKRSAC